MFGLTVNVLPRLHIKVVGRYDYRTLEFLELWVGHGLHDGLRRPISVVGGWLIQGRGRFVLKGAKDGVLLHPRRIFLSNVC
jgi:hypothetical protein